MPAKYIGSRTGAGGATLAGAAPRGYNTASGGVPGVTSPISTVTGNLGNLSSIINSLTASSGSALKEQYPQEYFGILGTLLGNTQRRAAGDISDLLPELQQGAAESAVAGGLSGSGAENTKLLRDLGLTRYGVQNQALKDLGTIQSELPLVRPFDPNAIIGSQLGAQERADIYASAPVPEEAYKRAMSAAGGGAPRGTPTRTFAGGGGGGGKGPGTADAALRGYAPNVGAYGTAMNPMGTSGVAPAPYGSTFGGGLPPGFWNDPAAALESFDPMWDTNPWAADFGGSLSYGGGEPWQPAAAGPTGQTAQNYDDYDLWLASALDIGGGLDLSGGGGGFGGSLDYGGGEGYYAGGEDFGLYE